MQLTSILLYQNLKEKFHIADYRLVSEKQPLARPFFYEADRGLQSHHIYLTEDILEQEVLQAMPGDVFFIICQKNVLSKLPAGNYSCLLLSDDTSLIQVFNCIQAIFDEYEEWERQMISICRQDGSLADLLEASRGIFKNPLLIVGPDFSLEAQAGLRELPDEYNVYKESSLLIERINAFSQDDSFYIPDQQRTPVMFPSYITGYRSLNMNLFLDDHAEYQLSVVENHTPISEAHWYLITILAQQAEYIIHRMRSDSSSRSNTLYSVFQRILSDKTADYMEISRLLQVVGWLPEHEYLCSVIRVADAAHSLLNAKTICQYIGNEFLASCSIVFKEHVVSFYNLSLLEQEPEDVFQTLVYFIRDSMLTAGYSNAMSGHMNLRRQYLQALTALTMGAQIQPERWIHHFSQIVLPYILRQITKTFPGEMLCHEKLLELQKADENQGTEYIKTLRVYLAHNLNAVQSAKTLFIHRSTFLYRLEKIKVILETDLEDADELFYLNLSLRLLDSEEKRFL